MPPIASRASLNRRPKTLGHEPNNLFTFGVSAFNSGVPYRVSPRVFRSCLYTLSLSPCLTGEPTTSDCRHTTTTNRILDDRSHSGSADDHLQALDARYLKIGVPPPNKRRADRIGDSRCAVSARTIKEQLGAVSGRSEALPTRIRRSGNLRPLQLLSTPSPSS